MPHVFRRIAERPVAALVFCGIVIALASLGLKNLVRDPSVDAFIPDDHPSFLASEQAKALFGLSDPVVIGLAWQAPGAVFEPGNLALIREIHDRVATLANVRHGGVTSLASESFVLYDEDALQITPYVASAGVEPEAARQAAAGWALMEPHRNTLVSLDGSAATILLELEDNRDAEKTYRDVMAAVGDYRSDGLTIHVAGLGAIVGYLSEAISSDVATLVPLTYIVVVGMMLIAFRSLKAVLVPLPVIVGAVAACLGLMAALGVPYFAITSALPVIVVAISVADTIYILTAYSETFAAPRQASVQDRIVAAMSEVVRPITLTTVTTAVGFVAIALASIMPPIVYFAWFAAAGIVFAWVFSVLAVPAMVVLLRLRLQPPPAANALFGGIGQRVVGHPLAFSLAVAAFLAVAAVLAGQVKVDRALVESFPADSSIRIADQALNEQFAGTAFLDVIIDSGRPDGLLSAPGMQRIADLQAYMETLPGVTKTLSIVDYLGQIHRALEGDEHGPRGLPPGDDAIAQYLLLYESSATPDALEEEIDAGYQYALVRGVLDTRYSSAEAAAVEGLQAYVDTEFAGAANDMTATLSGRVNTRYHWMNRLAQTHLAGVGLSVVAVFFVTAALLRSPGAAAAAVLPVLAAVLGLYAAMGVSGTRLEPATSMFAAISIGVGVDYAIHLVHRLRRELAATGDLARATGQAMRATGRACFFNAAALGCGFAVLMASDLLTLTRFGALIAVAAFASFLSAFILVPLLFRIARGRSTVQVARASGTAGCALCGLSLLAAALMPAGPVRADPAGLALATRVDQRNDGRYVRRELDMELINRRGAVRERSAVIVRSRDELERKALIVFQAPKAIRESAFLSYDRPGSDDDRRWLFLPAAGRVRRLPVSERGDSFLGTDFSYADIQSELKFNLDDFVFTDTTDGSAKSATHYSLSGAARNEAIAGELGYSRFESEVDRKTLLPTTTTFYGLDGAELKTVVVPEVAVLDGIAFAEVIEVTHARTGHRTVFHYRSVEFPARLDGALFEPSSLRRGISRRL